MRRAKASIGIPGIFESIQPINAYVVLVMVLGMASCTFDADRPQARSPRTETPREGAAPAELQMAGKVTADEFNDHASENEIPIKGGQVIVQFLGEPDNLSPFIDNSAEGSYIKKYIFDSLLRRNQETFEYEGSLAERWIEEDVVLKKNGEELRGMASFSGPEKSGNVTLRTSFGETIRIPQEEVTEVHEKASFTFFMRKDAKFHDGHPVTAWDVKFTYETIKNEHVDAASLRGYYNDVESCEVLDDYTVRMTYGKQYWASIDYTGGEDFMILPRHIYDPNGLQKKDPEAFGKQFNENEYNRKPVGSGPYKFDRWETGMQVILTRNDDYWNHEEGGYLDRLIFRFISDRVAGMQALKNGEVTFMTRATAEQFENEANDPKFLERFAKVEYFVPNLSYLGWNMRHPPLDDVRVRQALAYGALDIQEYIDEILYGRAIRVSGYQYYFGPAYNHGIQPYPFDPEKAKELLLDAGWYDRDGDGLRDKDGKPFRVEFLLYSGAAPQLPALIKENLRKLGIDLTVRKLEWATFLENIHDRKFDVCALGWALDLESDPYQIWHTSQRENRGSNHVGFGDEESDRLIEESRGTMDAETRLQLFFELNQIHHEKQPYMFLFTTPNLGMYDKRYRGVKWYKLRPGYDLTEWYIPESEQS